MAFLCFGALEHCIASELPEKSMQTLCSGEMTTPKSPSTFLVVVLPRKNDEIEWNVRVQAY